MARGIIILTIKDSGGDERQVRFMSSDGTENGDLSAVSTVERPALVRVSAGGSITAGGESQLWQAANPDNQYLELLNPPDGGGSIWFNDTGDDADPADDESYELLPGQAYTWPEGVASEVNIYGETTGQKFKGRKA